jgi:hypothetical protein
MNNVTTVNSNNPNEEKVMDNWEEMQEAELKAYREREDKMKKAYRRENILFVLAMVVIIAIFAGIFTHVVRKNARFHREKAAEARKQEIRQAEWVANSDYYEVVQQVEEFLEEKYRAENNSHPGIGAINTREKEGPLDESGNCTAWKWKGKIYTAEHCTRNGYRENAGDIVVPADKYPNEIKEDLYEIGLECSTDFRWWGKTTDMWGYVPFEQVFDHMKKGTPSMKEQNDMRWAFVDARNALEDASLKSPEVIFKNLVDTYKRYIAGASNQRFICAAADSLEVSPDHGDSGGPLMAGDEVIGFVSYTEWPQRETLGTGVAEDFEVKYNDALYVGTTDCWGSLDRSKDTVNLAYAKQNMERYEDLYQQFLLKYGQETISNWEK